MKLTPQKIRVLLVEITGWLLVLIGLAAIVLPGPGLLALFAGLSLLATRYEWAERRLKPVRNAAIKTAHDSVSSTSRIISSFIAALSLIGLGIVWGIRPNSPEWWPLAEKYWLAGGWGTGGALVGSGIIASVMLIYSYFKFRSPARSKNSG